MSATDLVSSLDTPTEHTKEEEGAPMTVPRHLCSYGLTLDRANPIARYGCALPARWELNFEIPVVAYPHKDPYVGRFVTGLFICDHHRSLTDRCGGRSFFAMKDARDVITQAFRRRDLGDPDLMRVRIVCRLMG